MTADAENASLREHAAAKRLRRVQRPIRPQRPDSTQLARLSTPTAYPHDPEDAAWSAGRVHIFTLPRNMGIS